MKDFLFLLKGHKKKAKRILRFSLIIKHPLFVLCVAVITFSWIALLQTYDTLLQRQMNQKKVISLPFILPSIVPYPNLQTVLGVNTNDTAIMPEPEGFSAQAAIVMDDSSKVVLFEKNPTIRFSMASTTKIMTALTALDYYALDDVLTVRSYGVEGSKVGFTFGETFYLRDLLYAMLLPSGNDAAVTIAQNYPGGVEAFVAQMNKKAQDFHLANTHFADVMGLDDEGDYTTVVDLARLCSIVMQNQIFREIVDTKQIVITSLNQYKSYELFNLNQLLGVDGVDGIKTGFTNEAAQVLTTSMTENGHRFIIVVMKSQDRFFDTKKLLSLIRGNTNYTTFNDTMSFVKH